MNSARRSKKLGMILVLVSLGACGLLALLLGDRRSPSGILERTAYAAERCATYTYTIARTRYQPNGQIQSEQIAGSIDGTLAFVHLEGESNGQKVVREFRTDPTGRYERLEPQGAWFTTPLAPQDITGEPPLQLAAIIARDAEAPRIQSTSGADRTLSFRVPGTTFDRTGVSPLGNDLRTGYVLATLVIGDRYAVRQMQLRGIGGESEGVIFDENVTVSDCGSK